VEKNAVDAESRRWRDAGYRPGYAECGLCQPPCATCRKCWTGTDTNCHVWDCPGAKKSDGSYDEAKAELLAKGDAAGGVKGIKTCDRKITNEPSAHFCTSCQQDKYNPPDVRDIQTIEDYVKNQAAMVLRSTEQEIPNK